MKEIAAAIASAALLGVGMGSLFHLPASSVQPPEWSYAMTGDEDPNVTLYRSVMGTDSPTAPQPYVPIPAWASEDWTEQDEHVFRAAWTDAPVETSPVEIHDGLSRANEAVVLSTGDLDAAADIPQDHRVADAQPTAPGFLLVGALDTQAPESSPRW